MYSMIPIIINQKKAAEKDKSKQGQKVSLLG
jgi:hypothetical protein